MACVVFIGLIKKLLMALQLNGEEIQIRFWPQGIFRHVYRPKYCRVASVSWLYFLQLDGNIYSITYYAIRL